MLYVSADDIRPDGRFRDELRKIEISRLNTDSSGPILFSQGNTKVVASVRSSTDTALLTFNLIFQESTGNDPNNDRKAFVMRNRLSEIFTPIIAASHSILVDLTVKQDDGSVFAALVNTVTVCLCCFGIPTCDICTAVSLNDSYDLSAAEYSKGYSVTVAFLRASHKLVYLESSGRCQLSMLERAISNGLECCLQISACIAAYLKDSIGQLRV